MVVGRLKDAPLHRPAVTMGGPDGANCHEALLVPLRVDYGIFSFSTCSPPSLRARLHWTQVQREKPLATRHIVCQDLSHMWLPQSGRGFRGWGQAPASCVQ